ncbi:SMP-30/gluconolactonase/LRE family protein [Hymenobacter aerilatus]|uniref:SMP-30/gluconolactonase/LRE family protein n=1 Tax=Hymenobacter aerilatus TaxID=2932251 RepID=A0A8T9SY17_9BACT|nr:SMP-30/gluconolactonase/LRE family protein [Hymenobacter aerilatus]UOR04679.1 SMP-30/gluconolactonase/LRE family protein [Hymenobacter aerilatus]
MKWTKNGRLLPVAVVVVSLALSAFAVTKRTLATDTIPMDTPDNQTTQLVAESATPQLIAQQFKFTEGPAVDRQGNVFFTDQPNNTIWQYDTQGKLSLFMADAGRANGMYFDAKGQLLACADEHNQLWSINPENKKVQVLVKDVDGKRLNGPNDVWAHPKTGNIYFTDPYYQRDYWTHTSPDMVGQKVFLLTPGQSQPVVVDDQMRKPNGIIGTPDGRYLYVADIDGDKTYRYQFGSDGRLTDKQLFAEMGSDGMTLDEKGNVYLTGHGVTVYSAAGQKIAHFDVPEEWTGNICFAGKDRKMLFITASKGIYKLSMRVKGAY